ncbi:MAG: hypothetical protein WBW94_15000 [Anaerolineales bacterium]
MKKYLVVLLQGLGATIGFLVSLVIANTILPLSQLITAKTPSTGFLSLPLALLFSSIVNAVILVWAARRSSFRGFAMLGQLFVLSFGVQTFQTQIETGYFISAFPLLHGNFEVYRLILRGFVTSAVFAALVTLIVGGFGKAIRPAASFTVNADRAVKQSSWLAVIYFVLYMLFGYYIAWQSQELRLFYGGPAQLNSFINQWLITLMGKPELPVFQYFRGVIWILCLIPLFKGFSGKRVELIILSALALGLLPTAQLALPNPLMPAGVSYFHFWEVTISTGIFGALCAWFIPIPESEQ